MCKNPLKRKVASQFLNVLAQFLRHYQHFRKKKKKKKKWCGTQKWGGRGRETTLFFYAALRIEILSRLLWPHESQLTWSFSTKWVAWWTVGTTKDLQKPNSDTYFFAYKIKTNYFMTKQVVHCKYQRYILTRCSVNLLVVFNTMVLKRVFFVIINTCVALIWALMC